METTEVVVKTNPEALEAAGEAVKKMAKFSNEEEAAANLEIADVKSLKALPLYTLCNKIGKILFKRGFIAGYVIRDGKSSSETNEVNGDKAKKAQRSIYALKLINKILSIASSKKISMFEVDNATAEVFCNHGTLKSEDFDNVFKNGDTRADGNLGLVRASIANKQSRE